MNVGILGTGVVGDALAAGFTSRGHDVRQGSASGSLCELWVAVGVRRGAWDHAFALLTT